MLVGAEATAVRAQPSGKGGYIVVPETLSYPVCLRRIFTACILGALAICDLKCRLRTQILFLLTMFIKENILK